jgi:hypothetical protein
MQGDDDDEKGAIQAGERRGFTGGTNVLSGDTGEGLIPLDNETPTYPTFSVDAVRGSVPTSRFSSLIGPC